MLFLSRFSLSLSTLVRWTVESYHTSVFELHFCRFLNSQKYKYFFFCSSCRCNPLYIEYRIHTLQPSLFYLLFTFLLPDIQTSFFSFPVILHVQSMISCFSTFFNSVLNFFYVLCKSFPFHFFCTIKKNFLLFFCK